MLVQAVTGLRYNHLVRNTKAPRLLRRLHRRAADQIHTTPQACWLCRDPEQRPKLINLSRSALKAAKPTVAPPSTMPPLDPCTLSNHERICITHSDLELDVDFATKTVHGFVKHVAAVVDTGVNHLVLDTRDVVVDRVVLCSDDQTETALNFSFGETHKAYGTPLIIELPEALSTGAEVEIGVFFASTAACTGGQFLEPAMTRGKQHPFFFTQFQAIHARSIVPCQDTPAVKFTYNAVLRVPQALTGLMSALPVEDAAQEWQPRSHLGQPQAQSRCFFFRQPVPIPSYLLAMAVGELNSRPLGPRSRVWAEPSFVDACAWEYQETAAFLEAGEAVAGEYVWGRYDLLVLPPSFPYGGMENPNITFMTPTTIAGDRSQTRVVAHEISHSWFGNLVTNASWQHFWLNEGWTVYLERRILGRLYGQSVMQFNAAQGRQGMHEAVELFGASHGFTALCPDLTVEGGVDPDDAFSRIPYEKGFHLIYHLQELAGGEEAFTPFVRAYVQRFRFSTVTSAQFRAFVTKYFKDNAAIQTLDWDTWLFAPGMPPVDNSYDDSMADAPRRLAEAWDAADPQGSTGAAPQGASADDLKEFTVEQVIVFVETLQQTRAKTPLSPVACRKMNELYGFDGKGNTEIKTAWLRLCIEAGDESVYPLVKALLCDQGRMKYLRPIYRALAATPSGKEFAKAVFAEAGPTYHPIASKMVGADLA